MTATDLIVPVKVNALVVNRLVRTAETFNRWTPNFDAMLDEGTGAEPAPGVGTETMGPESEGVYVQWQLPEALADGHYDQTTGETTFPFVPNRWLVVRYSTTAASPERTAAGWIVQSDYLESRPVQDADGNDVYGTNKHPDPDSPEGEKLRLTFLGRRHALADGPWTEPAPQPPHLTAAGPGLPGFAVYQPYNKDVFSLHDTLDDLKGALDNYPPDATLSYFVVGWYSDDELDYLTTAASVPGLLPPDAEGTADLLEALGWSVPAGTVPGALERTLYSGSALGIKWEREGVTPESDKPSNIQLSEILTLGSSSAEALGRLAARQTRSARTGDLVRSLFQGTLETLDTADGEEDLDTVTHHSWFSGSDGGHVWKVTARPVEGDAELPPPPPEPAWLAQLNGTQRQYDELTPRLRRARQRLWNIWWLRHKPVPAFTPEHPEGFDARADLELDEQREGSLARSTAQLLDEQFVLARQLPTGATPEELRAAVDAYAAERGLDPKYQLERTARESYYRPADPVVLIKDTGAKEPLTRDTPLPCRLPEGLLTRIKVDGQWIDRPTTPPTPGLTGLPAACTPLLAEFALLDLAARVPGALPAALADSGSVVGPVPEYAAQWRQPWLPMHLEYEVKYCPTPYQADETTYWTFNGSRYEWSGEGAQRGNGEADLRWLTFKNRAFLTPSAPYVLQRQIDRYLDTYSAAPVDGLLALREELGDPGLLSQRLDGFHDWLVQQDGAARTTVHVPAATTRLVGDIQSVPDPGLLEPPPDDPGTPFQPVRAGQFFFHDLRIVDRFGQAYDIVNSNNYEQVSLTLGESVTPDAPPDEDLIGQARFVQLGPRLMQGARVRLETVRAVDGNRLSPMARAATLENPLAGWLLLNHLDQTLVVHGPDGVCLGELRVVTDTDGRDDSVWLPLPGSPHPDPDAVEFERAMPHLAGFVRALKDKPAAALAGLLETIDKTLDTILDDAAQDDSSPLRLVGRPLALVRADLGIELEGPLLSNPSWDEVLGESEEEYDGYRWPVRLGNEKRLGDGLIGYFSGATGPDQDTSYDVFHAVLPEGGGDYLVPIDKGHALAVPARTPEQPVTHHLTLLMDPYAAVHATTDILPVTRLELPDALVSEAVRRIRTSFRLGPLLAPERADKAEEPRLAAAGEEPPTAGIVLPRPASWHGEWSWAEPRGAETAWVELPIVPADTAAHFGDPQPQARYGYLLLDATGG
ncbi:hypothetical protein [Yinghuangia seranimata]|uniref:hypothetical protein n=1 Tax=Yinghuangia seranimata TaxID=408067 RepID=UPI00248B5754|nr:hypothetical protein [Yinghuangia seranimata]MDI2130036.1 hypothetical protein [Yinghuangia seranimata]